MEFRTAPVKPRKRHYRLIIGSLALIALAIPSFSLGPKVEQAEAYTWGAWSTPRYYAVSTAECTMARAANRKYLANLIGPPNPSAQAIGCRQRLRWRKMNVPGRPAPWKDIVIQIDNTGPFGGYGMQLTSNVRWNTRIVHADEPICREWAFIIKVTREACKVVNNDTGRLWLRMDYKASWDFLWANVQAGRGATIDISRSGWIGPVVRWP
jgi:hypothetical protein